MDEGQWSESEDTISEVQGGFVDEDDGEPTLHPDFEYLATDGGLPWNRTELVGFQKDAARAAYEALRRGPNAGALLVLPEGAGKVRVALDIALGGFLSRGARVLWVGSRRDLLEQVHEEVRELAWLLGRLGEKRMTFSISRYASQHRDPNGDIVLASARALWEGQAGIDEFERSGPISLICVDDVRMLCDESFWNVVMRLRSESVRVLGITGIPLRYHELGNDAIRTMFGDSAAFERSFKDLVDERFLSRPVFVRKKIASTRTLQMNAEELQVASFADVPPLLQRALTRDPLRLRETLGHWLDNRVRYGRTLMFAYDMEHADAMIQWLNAHGVACEAVHPWIEPALHQQRLARFRKGLAEVLVHVGLMTEGEHVPEVRTVMLLRPTISPALYKHMIGWGSRRSAVVEGKTHFFVVDCVDELDRFGIALAGRAAAVDLGLDFQDTTTLVLSELSLERRRRRDRALISARAWHILRRLADDQYTVWGELVWELPDGGEKSVAVFHEGVAGLVPYVAAIVDAIASGTDVGPLRDCGAELDWIGAVREVDWQEMISDCARSRRPPRLEHVETAEVTETGEAAGRVIALLVEDVLAQKTSLAQACAGCDAMVAESGIMRAQFPNARDLRQEIVKLYNDSITRFEQANPPEITDRERMTKSFMQFAVAMAMADHVLLDSESRVIEKAAARMFELTSLEQRQWIFDAVEHYRLQPLDVKQAAETLRGVATADEIHHMYDWLFRVAFADGVFAAEEASFLREAALHLGIAPEVFEQLVERYAVVSKSPASLLPPAMPGEPAPMPLVQLRYCTGCGYPRQSGAEFCVSCGAELRLRPGA
jgi:superfamily II DNA or RNA helicase